MHLHRYANTQEGHHEYSSVHLFPTRDYYLPDTC